MGNWCLQTLSHLESEGVPSPLSKCQNLILHAPVSQRDLPGIAYMLRSSPCLEKLVIHLPDLSRSKFELDEESQERFNSVKEDFLCSQKENFEFLGEHLKRVEITGSEADSFGSKHLLALIEFILGDALVLEKLIIKAELHTLDGSQVAVLSKLLDVSTYMLTFRRASKTAVVFFNYPRKFESS
ncbi:hypothetical protein NL676_007087 [Syzygium grande]|nr:hypothetical protein NL676_007087 [Syzygium grande]